MSNPLIQLLVLAGIAVFLILKLRGVLGTRDGYERPPLPPQSPARPVLAPVEEAEHPDQDIADHVDLASPAGQALRAMKQAEPAFSLAGFLQGARGAYEMILMGFERGDIEAVRPFLAPAVAEAFDTVIADRTRQGLTVTSEFLGLREMSVAAAEFDPATGEAEITMRFVGELSSHVTDANGKSLEPEGKATRKQRDIWTFARKMGASDPNWELVATGG